MQSSPIAFIWFLLAFVLLAPFSWLSWRMATQERSLRQISRDANEEALLEIYRGQFEGDVDEKSVMIAFRGSTTLSAQIPGLSTAIFFARRWVGILGLVCSVLLVVCMFMCCFVPTGDLSGRIMIRNSKPIVVWDRNDINANDSDSPSAQTD